MEDKIKTTTGGVIRIDSFIIIIVEINIILGLEKSKNI